MATISARDRIHKVALTQLAGEKGIRIAQQSLRPWQKRLA